MLSVFFFPIIITFLTSSLAVLFSRESSDVLLSIVTDLPCFLFHISPSTRALQTSASFLVGLGSLHLSRWNGAVKRWKKREKTQGECGARADKHARKIFSIVPRVLVLIRAVCPFPNLHRSLIIGETCQGRAFIMKTPEINALPRHVIGRECITVIDRLRLVNINYVGAYRQINRPSH